MHPLRAVSIRHARAASGPASAPKAIFLKIVLASVAAFPYIYLCDAGLAQLVARHLAKVEVAGSNPVARSRVFSGPVHSAFFMARWPSGKAEACKAFTPGSNPGLASIQDQGTRSGGCPFSCADACVAALVLHLKPAIALHSCHSAPPPPDTQTPTRTNRVSCIELRPKHVL